MSASGWKESVGENMVVKMNYDFDEEAEGMDIENEWESREMLLSITSSS